MSDSGKYKFSRIFYDEADISRFTGLDLNSYFTWYVSSTFKSLVYPHGYQYYYNSRLNEFSKFYLQGYTANYINTLKCTLIKNKLSSIYGNCKLWFNTYKLSISL